MPVSDSDLPFFIHKRKLMHWWSAPCKQ